MSFEIEIFDYRASLPWQLIKLFVSQSSDYTNCKWTGTYK